MGTTEKRPAGIPLTLAGQGDSQPKLDGPVAVSQHFKDLGLLSLRWKDWQRVRQHCMERGQAAIIQHWKYLGGRNLQGERRTYCTSYQTN